MRLTSIHPNFVEFIPRDLSEGILYISEQYQTASHLCACGCGEKVVTPLSPVDWKLKKHGELISLFPSIGNWNYSCKSHYWIRNNKIIWAEPLSPTKIAQIQRKDLKDKEKYIEYLNLKKESSANQPHKSILSGPSQFQKTNIWSKLAKLIIGEKKDKTS